MKEAIISFLMSAVVATGVGWIKDKMAFPVTAVEKLKTLAQEADTQSLAMKVLGGDMDHSMLVSMPKCLAENKTSAEPCVAQGMDLLKSSLAKRAETFKAAAVTQTAAADLNKLINDAPFSDSVKPLLEPITARLKTAQEGIGKAQTELDGGMASVAGKLLALKGGSAQMTELLQAMKAAGLDKALEQAKIIVPPATAAAK